MRALCLLLWLCGSCSGALLKETYDAMRSEQCPAGHFIATWAECKNENTLLQTPLTVRAAFSNNEWPYGCINIIDSSAPGLYFNGKIDSAATSPKEARWVCKEPNAPPAPPAPRVSHNGFADVSWWNSTLWRNLKKEGVDCNPAKCVNNATCGIPNCMLVYFTEFYHAGGRHSLQSCDTTAKQESTEADGCIPGNMRHSWPTDMVTNLNADEQAACLGITDNVLITDNGLRNTVTSGWHMHPASRVVFCQAGYYVTYLFVYIFCLHHTL